MLRVFFFVGDLSATGMCDLGPLGPAYRLRALPVGYHVIVASPSVRIFENPFIDRGEIRISVKVIPKKVVFFDNHYYLLYMWDYIVNLTHFAVFHEFSSFFRSTST